MRYAERFFLAAMAVYVIVLPVSGTVALRSLSFALLLGVTAWQAAARRLRLDFLLVGPWAIYAAVALISLLYADSQDYSLGEIRVEIAYVFAVFVIAASWIRSPAQLSRLVWILVIGNVLFIAGSAWTAICGRHPQLCTWSSGSWDAGTGATATVIATVLPWVVVLAVRTIGERRYRSAFFLGCLCLANLGVLSLTINRQGWISLTVSFAVAAVLAGKGFWTRQRMLAAGTAAVLFIGVFAFQFHQRTASIVIPRGGEASLDASIQVVNRDVRWSLWRFSMERIAEQPWSGGGFGREAFKRLYPDYYRTHIPLWHAHNMVLNKGIQMGIPGMLAFLALWIALAASCAKGLRVPGMRPWCIATLAMIAGIFVRNMADDFFVRDHALMFWLLCGACLGALRQATQSPSRVS